MIDWGQIVEGRLDWGDELAPRTTRGRLFIESDGRLIFPTATYRAKLWNKISARGYLNDSPMVEDFEIPGLTSADHVLFSAMLRVTLQVKATETAWSEVVRQHSSLDAQLLTTLRSGLAPAAAVTYAELKFSPEMLGRMTAGAGAAIRAASPYEMRDAAIAVQAKDRSIDEALEREHSAPIVDRASDAPRRIQASDRARRHEVDIEEVKRRLELEQLISDQDRRGRQEALNDELEATGRRERQKLQVLVETIEAVPDARNRLSPEQWLLLEKARLATAEEVAELSGKLQAVQTLLGQPLLPERTEHVYRGLPFTVDPPTSETSGAESTSG